MSRQQHCELIIEVTSNNPLSLDTNDMHLAQYKNTPSSLKEEKKEQKETDTENSCNFKSMSNFKKEWKKGKQVGWGGQASIFEVTQNIKPSSAPSDIPPIQYVAKIIYFTNEDIYESMEDRINAIHTVMNEYKMVKAGNLLNYVDLYYDERHHNKAIIIMEKLSYSLSSKRDWNQEANKYDVIRQIAKDLAENIKEIHDLEYAHLDINKQNIMWNEKNMRWRIIDYGLAKYIDPNQGYIKYDKFIGTKTWTAPEIILSETVSCDGDNDGIGSILSKKCDVYSYGLVILNIVCGGNHYGELLKCKDSENDNELNELSEIEMLKQLNTEEGHYMLNCRLLKLKQNGIIDSSLYVFLSRILTYDPAQRPTIDQVLNMYYLKT